MASGDKVYIADKATLDGVDEKIGNTTDSGGSSTAGSVFGKINYLVSQASTYLSSIYARIGSQSDTASGNISASTHAKLNWFLNLFGKTDDAGGSATAGSAMAKENAILTKVGDESDTGNGTVFGILKGFREALDRIGFPNDIAATNSTGTVMGKLNSILNLLVGGQVIFTTAGVYSLKIPSGIQKITVTACGGGGGGGGSAELVTSSMVYFKSGGGASSGCAISEVNYTVTPLSTLSITVGGGGAGGTSERRTTSSSGTASAGVKGGSTIIGNLVTLAGGNPGQGGSFLNSQSTPIASGGTSAGTGSGYGYSGSYHYDTVNGYPDGGSSRAGGLGGSTILGGEVGTGGTGGTFIRNGNEATAEELTPTNATAGKDGYVLIKWGVL